jgi:hypothetical protein
MPTADPMQADEAEIAAVFRPIYKARSHWIVCRPLPPPDAVRVFLALGLRTTPDEPLALLPLPLSGLTLVVLAVPRSKTRPRHLLDALGFTGGLDVDRLEEELAAGKDLICLTDVPALAGAIAATLQRVFEDRPPAAETTGPQHRPHLDLLKRYPHRPTLRRFLRTGSLPRGVLSCTLSPGQWDELLALAYDRGGVLIEVDTADRVLATFRKRGAAAAK